MKPEQLPLLLASDKIAGEGETQPLDRVRMQKAVFLAEQRGPAEWRLLYEFVPYNWGPFSRDLQDDLAVLVSEGRLDLLRTHTGQYRSYVASGSVRTEVDRILLSLEPRKVNFLRSIRRFVVTRSFERLLRDVYGAYPSYSTKSQFH
jgi:uncharacterized protein